MKRTVFKITLFVLTGVQIIPAQAMWTSAARAALRSGQFNASTRLAPATIAGSNLLYQQPVSRLLARTLASKHSQDYSGYNRDEQKAGSNSNSSDSNGYNWRSLFSQADKAQILGGTILGWHLWWSDSDICQKPEDFQNPEKLARTKECYATGNKDLVFDTFVRNFNALKQSPEALSRVLEFFCTTFDYFKDYSNKLTDLEKLVVNNYHVFKENKLGKQLIQKIERKDPYYFKDLTFYTFIHNFSDIRKNPAAFQVVLEFFNMTFDNFKSHTDFSNLEWLVLINYDMLKANKLGIELIQKIEAKDASFHEKLSTSQLFAHAESQSALHFRTLKNQIQKLDFFYSSDLGREGCNNVIKHVLKLEHQELLKGNYTFVHGYNRQMHFYQDIDTHLRAALYGTPTDSLSLRFIKQPNIKKKDTHAIKRKKIMASGAKNYYKYDGLQKNMIFMTCGIFGAPLRLIARNSSVNNTPNNILEKVFNRLHLNAFLLRYKQEIEELQTLHEQASTFGAGILFSFTPEMLEKTVYVCRPGGIKRTVNIYGIGETDDVKLILDTLRTSPELIEDLDHLEFVFVVTKDCGLNPHVVKNNGIKAIPFNAADPEKMALYEQKRDELMAKIKADIEAERAAQTAEEKAQHEKKIAAMMTWYASHSCLEGCKESRVIS